MKSYSSWVLLIRMQDVRESGAGLVGVPALSEGGFDGGGDDLRGDGCRGVTQGVVRTREWGGKKEGTDGWRIDAFDGDGEGRCKVTLGMGGLLADAPAVGDAVDGDDARAFLGNGHGSGAVMPNNEKGEDGGKPILWPGRDAEGASGRRGGVGASGTRGEGEVISRRVKNEY